MTRCRREKTLEVSRISITICPPQAENFGDFGGVFIQKNYHCGENSPPQAGNFWGFPVIFTFGNAFFLRISSISGVKILKIFRLRRALPPHLGGEIVKFPPQGLGFWGGNISNFPPRVSDSGGEIIPKFPLPPHLGGEKEPLIWVIRKPSIWSQFMSANDRCCWVMGIPEAPSSENSLK